MAKKAGTVAPKERINIVYRPATGDAQEEVELPLKLLIMSDFTLEPDDRPLEDRNPVNLDKDNFNEVLKAMDLSRTVNVRNTLSGPDSEDNQMTVSLKFESLKDFEPDSIVEQDPELTKLMKLREALVSLKGPLGSLRQFRERINEIMKDEGERARLFRELGAHSKIKLHS